MVDVVQVRKALGAVMDPELNRNLVELGMVKHPQDVRPRGRSQRRRARVRGRGLR